MKIFLIICRSKSLELFWPGLSQSLAWGEIKDISRWDSSLLPFLGDLGNSSGLGWGRKVFLGLPGIGSHNFLLQVSPDCLK